MIGTSATCNASPTFLERPIGCLEVGYVDSEIVLNPTQEQRKTPHGCDRGRHRGERSS